MSSAEPNRDLEAENERLLYELEQAEIYEQKLRQLIVDVKNQLAAGNDSMALSMLNEVLREIDNATDVVAPSKASPPD